MSTQATPIPTPTLPTEWEAKVRGTDVSPEENWSFSGDLKFTAEGKIEGKQVYGDKTAELVGGKWTSTAVEFTLNYDGKAFEYKGSLDWAGQKIEGTWKSSEKSGTFSTIFSSIASGGKNISPPKTFGTDNLCGLWKLGTTNFKIISRDQEYNPTTVGGAKFTANLSEIDTKKEKKIEIQDNKDGTYTGTFTFGEEDKKPHSLSISYINPEGKEEVISGCPYTIAPLDLPLTTEYPDAAGYKIPYVFQLPTNPYASYIGFENLATWSYPTWNFSKPYVYNITDKAPQGWYRLVTRNSGSGSNAKLVGKILETIGMWASGGSGSSSTNYPEGARGLPMATYGFSSYFNEDLEHLIIDVTTDEKVVQYYMDEMGVYEAKADGSKTEYSGNSAWVPGQPCSLTINFQTSDKQPAQRREDVKLEINHVKSKTSIPFETSVSGRASIGVTFTPPSGLDFGEIKIDMYWGGEFAHSKSLYAWALFVDNWQKPSDSSSSSSDSSSSYEWKPPLIVRVNHPKFLFVGCDQAPQELQDGKLKITLDNPFIWSTETKTWVHFSWNNEEGKLGEHISREICSALGLNFVSFESKNIVSEWSGFQNTKAMTYDSEKGIISFPEYLHGLKKIVGTKDP